MRGFEELTVIGTVGRDAEMKYTPAGDAVTTFSVVVNRKTKEGDEARWYTVSCWRKLAEIAAQYVKKGDRVFVRGRPDVRSWDGDDGQRRNVWQIDADTLQLLGGQQAG